MQPVPCSPGSVSELQDRFDDGYLAPIWSQIVYGAMAIGENGGELTIGTQDLAADQYSEIATRGDYNMVDCSAFIKLARRFDATAPAYTHFTVRNAANEAMEFGISGVGLDLKIYQGGQPIFFQTLPFDQDAYTYLQLREAQGTMYWEASPDARTWTVLDSHPTSISLDAVKVLIGGGTFAALAAPLDPAAFDDLNVQP